MECSCDMWRCIEGHIGPILVALEGPDSNLLSGVVTNLRVRLDQRTLQKCQKKAFDEGHIIMAMISSINI
jgi:hypothetical protein